MKLGDIVKLSEYTEARNWAVENGYTMRKVDGGYQIVEIPSASFDELCASKRAERDRAIESVIWRVQRYEQQKQLGIQTTDSDKTYMNILKYIQYLRDVPNKLSFPDVNVLKFEEWEENNG